jgi:asparagine synthase (glutamine-hydrolysing)
VVLARTRGALDEFRPERLDRFSCLWHASPDLWWVDADAGIAMLAPEVVAEGAAGELAVLAIRGSVVANGLDGPPPGWRSVTEPAAGNALLYDLLARDTAAVADMRGQFALALWDSRRRRLLVARDHLGQRCVFVRTAGNLIILCSELAPLLRLGACSLDHESAFWYLAFGMPPPGRTLARGIDRVPAAHALVWEPRTAPGLLRYWTPLDAEAAGDADEAVVADLRGALDRAVARALPNEDVLGVLLSGGVDSTYLAVTSTALGRHDAVALTAAFEPELGMNESDYAEAVAQWLELRHDVVHLSAPEARELLDEVVLAAAEPCAAWAVLTHVRTLAHAHALGLEVVLSGLGADEIFGGYDQFRGYYGRFIRDERRRSLAPRVDHFEALLLAETQSARRVLYPGIARFFDDRALREALTQPYRDWHYASHLRAFYRECRRLKPEAHVMEMMVAHECQHRIPDLLFAGFEPMSRRLGVEVAYPFLDPDVVRRATALRVESRYRTASGRFSLRLRDLNRRFKHGMMLVASDRVPVLIRERPRKSLTAPFGAWMFDPAFADGIVRRIRESGFWAEDMVREEWLEEILRHLEPRPSPWAFQLWALVTLTAWYDRFVSASR